MLEFETRGFPEGLVRAFAAYYFYRILLEHMRHYCRAATAEMKRAKRKWNWSEVIEISLYVNLGKYLLFNFVDVIL